MSMSNRGGRIKQGPHETKSIQNIKYTHFSISPVSSLLLRCFSLGWSALHVLKCLPQAYSNQPAPKRSFTTAHRNISSSFATNALNPIKCLHTLPNAHQNAQIATCCLSSLCHDGFSANKNQWRELSPTLRQWGFKIAHWLDKSCVCISECTLMHEQPERTAQKGELYFWLP